MASAEDEFKKQERYDIAIKKLSSMSFFGKGDKLYLSWLIEKNDRILKDALAEKVAREVHALMAAV